MHWSNGRFHENLTVSKNIYITDHKHLAISGNVHFTSFGETKTDSNLLGKNVNITANKKFSANSTDGSNFWSKQYIRIEAGTDSPSNSDYDGEGIEFYSKDSDIKISSDLGDVVIETAGYLKINSLLTVNNLSYGPVLPSHGTEGRIFFKLIS